MDDYTDLFPVDCEQFEIAGAAYLSLASEDYETAYDLAKTCWILAARWSEIMADAQKHATANGLSAAKLSDWAYRHYRLLLLAHEHCRMIWRQGKDDSRSAV
jgi:hypothetical protein